MDRKCTIRGILLSLAAIIILPASAIARGDTVTRHAEGLPTENPAVFPATIIEDGRELGLMRIVWSAAKQSGRKASYAVTYSFGAQVQGVKAPSKVRALYYDRATGTNVLAPLSFIRQSSQKTSPAAETERFFHVSTEANAYPLFAGIRLPYSAKRPVITGDGVKDALLASMYYDPAVYSIAASRWDGPKTVKGGQYGRWAVYTLHRTTTTYSAIYAANIALPDVRVYNGVAHYSADATAVAAAKASETQIGTSKPRPDSGTHEPTIDWRTLWPFAAAAALAATGAVLFWYRRGKKRVVEEGEATEDEITEVESDSTGESEDD